MAKKRVFDDFAEAFKHYEAVGMPPPNMFHPEHGWLVWEGKVTSAGKKFFGKRKNKRPRDHSRGRR